MLNASRTVEQFTEAIDRLNVAARHDGVRLIIGMQGAAELSEPSALTDALLHYEKEAERIGTSKIVVDLRAVDALSCPAFAAFVEWLSALKERTPEFQVRFLLDSRQHWQQGHLHALCAFAVGRVSIEAMPVIAFPGATA